MSRGDREARCERPKKRRVGLKILLAFCFLFGNEKSRETLDKLSDVLIEFPDTNVLVVGHTDNTGREEYNMTLSRNRAYAVTDYFTQTKGLSPGRFTTNWFGESAPIADNNTAEGRAQNRRVNIVIVPNDKMKEDAMKEAEGN